MRAQILRSVIMSVAEIIKGMISRIMRMKVVFLWSDSSNIYFKILTRSAV